MIQVTVTIQFQGKNYVTNVLTNREATEEKIMKQALDQVKKQWTH
jgi:hypothetical protein